MFILDAINTNNPDWITIGGSIFGSSVFSYLVTLTTTNWVKKREFEWAYKTYIFEKRKKAYDALLSIIIKVFELNMDKNGRRYSGVFNTKYSKEHTTKLQSEMVRSNIHLSWYTNEMNNLIVEFRNYFIPKLDAFYREGNPDIRDGYKATEAKTILMYNKKFRDQYDSDIKNLHKVDEFLKNRL